MRNVVLTGLPRSGTTLTVALLNRLDDVVALHEPMDFAARPLGGPTPWETTLRGYFDDTRHELLTLGATQTRVIDGAEDNPFGADRDAAGLRTSRVQLASIRVDKHLSSQFTLIVKHPMAFTAIVDKLVGRVPTFALVRNPLALLASWASVNGNFNRGRIPAAEELNEAIRARLERCDDVVERQLIILDWMFSQYARHLRSEQIIRYENLIASRGKALAVIIDKAERLDESLEERNANRLYDAHVMSRLAERLLAADGAQWEFYRRTDVEQLAARALAAGR